MENDDENRKRLPDHWEIDRRIPAALIIALLAQFAGAVWWLSNIGSTVQDHDRRLAALEVINDKRGDSLREILQRLVRIETLLSMSVKPAVPPGAAN